MDKAERLLSSGKNQSLEIISSVKVKILITILKNKNVWKDHLGNAKLGELGLEVIELLGQLLLLLVPQLGALNLPHFHVCNKNKRYFDIFTASFHQYKVTQELSEESFDKA